MRFDSCCGESVGGYGAIRVAMSVYGRKHLVIFESEVHILGQDSGSGTKESRVPFSNPTYADLSHKLVARLGRRIGSGYVGRGTVSHTLLNVCIVQC
jgi:hypothetical protein